MIRDLDTARKLVRLVWPELTEVEPGQLVATTSAVVVVLAEARVQLDLIRAARRKG